MLEAVARRAGELMSSIPYRYIGYPVLQRLEAVCHDVTGRLNLPVLRFQGTVSQVPHTATTNEFELEQTRIYLSANVIPERLLVPGFGGGGYLAFLGRISPEKGPDAGIRIARKARMPLRIAAKVDDVDRHYFGELIKPLLADPDIEFIGEIGDHQKAEFLANAAALLFPIAWAEPFGLAMIEAMACGTPVIAFRRASVPKSLTMASPVRRRWRGRGGTSRS
jgi:glycosyltransferase involved in cell wall biosynthesis